MTNSTPASGGQDQFVLGHAPDEYDTLDPNATGRWYTLSLNGHSAGVIWTDDADGVGFVQIPATTASSEDLSRLTQQLIRFKGIDVPASTVFDAIKMFEGYEANIQEYGSLGEVDIRSLVAAGEIEASSAQRVGGPIATDDTGTDPSELEPYNFVAINEDGAVVGVGRSTAEAILFRDNGTWVPLPDEDLRFDACEWLAMSDEKLNQYDESELRGAEFTREDVENSNA